jgi:5-methylcytosine-specific restriction endonuclease McrA
MPIRPDRMALYPGGSIRSKEWQEIRCTILIRARCCCEGTPTHPDCRAVDRRPHPETGGFVVLTIAHMDHDEANNDPENLRALCQRCHNSWDAPMRRRGVAARAKATKAAGDLFDEPRDD